MDSSPFRPGDIMACFGTDRVSRTISWGTAWPIAPQRLRIGPSHVAMICEPRDHGPLWVESTTLCRAPCVYKGKQVAGCQAHFPEDRIEDYCGNGGRIDVYRLVKLLTLSESDSKKLTNIFVDGFVRRGVEYDTGAAIISGTRLGIATRILGAFGANHDEIFCSALIARMLMMLNRMNWADCRKYNPATLLRRLLKTGVYEYVRSYTPDSRPFQTVGIFS